MTSSSVLDREMFARPKRPGFFGYPKERCTTGSKAALSGAKLTR